MSNLTKYNDGEVELAVSFDKETIWLSQLQISELFDTSSDNVSLHLKNIYTEKELDENVTTEDFSVVRQEGKRKVKRTIKHYNLENDMQFVKSNIKNSTLEINQGIFYNGQVYDA